MWCWTDSSAPAGYPPSAKPWFYVIQAADSPSPGKEGYVYSALIPSAEQIITPLCTTERLLATQPRPPAPPEPAPEPSEKPKPTPAPPSAPPPAPPTSRTPEPPRTSSPPPPPATTAPAVPPTRHTVREQSGRHGSPAFLNPHNASGVGITVPAHAWVDIECRIYAPGIRSAEPDNWWYRIASSPWNGRYYAVGNTFMNGDAPGQNPPTNTDWSVPVC
ncbi:hypothetical protein [Streptomyces sp. NPDC058674]|uniref:hypothetical protein n=1 Tax=Streptomyces sp. NPDC058674 TaxID=3346592 RepID=UPI00364C0F12